MPLVIVKLEIAKETLRVKSVRVTVDLTVPLTIHLVTDMAYS